MCGREEARQRWGKELHTKEKEQGCFCGKRPRSPDALLGSTAAPEATLSLSEMTSTFKPQLCTSSKRKWDQ